MIHMPPYLLRFDSIRTEDGFITEFGVPIGRAKYTRIVCSVDELAAGEKEQMLKNYVKMQEMLSGLMVQPIVRVIPDDTILDNIIAYVCASRGVSIEEVMRKTRKREIAFTRQLCMFLMKNKTKASLKTIGAKFDGEKKGSVRDHTTVIHSIRLIRNLVETSDAIRDEVFFYLNKSYDKLPANGVEIKKIA